MTWLDAPSLSLILSMRRRRFRPDDTPGAGIVEPRLVEFVGGSEPKL